jgi:uncharacterized protein
MIGDIGWAATTTRTPLAEPIEVEGFTVTEAVWSVTWTADGDGLPPQQFAEFELSVGPFPDAADQLVMPATQTYSHGEVVDWAEPTVEGEDEPEQPAPVLDLTPANDSDSDRSDDATDTLARVLGIAGVALGAAGLVFGLAARRSRPNTTS